jgi:hypothetical protein
VDVATAVGVDDATAVGVDVATAVGVDVATAVGVAVGAGVTVRSGVRTTDPALHATRPAAQKPTANNEDWILTIELAIRHDRPNYVRQIGHGS